MGDFFPNSSILMFPIDVSMTTTGFLSWAAVVPTPSKPTAAAANAKRSMASSFTRMGRAAGPPGVHMWWFVLGDYPGGRSGGDDSRGRAAGHKRRSALWIEPWGTPYNEGEWFVGLRFV